MLPLPIDFKAWLEEHGDTLKPPVNNRCVYRGDDFIVMAVGGPNQRNDFHINETEEWFYQLRGEMCLRVACHEGRPDNSGPVEFQDICIREGQMFLLPGNTPHSPIRFAGTVGLVIERTRTAANVDRLRWYCAGCRGVVYEEAFNVVDINNQLKVVMEKYAGSPELRCCKACGTAN